MGCLLVAMDAWSNCGMLACIPMLLVTEQLTDYFLKKKQKRRENVLDAYLQVL